MKAWFILIIAGLFEIGFTTCMKLSEGFTQLTYTIGFIIFAGLSLFFLNKSLSEIPLGTAYAMWTGIGAFGTALIGMLFFKDPVSYLRVFFLALLVSSILGLKFIAIK
jgi:quaternary ammonium compound-resistance protein SugE